MLSEEQNKNRIIRSAPSKSKSSLFLSALPKGKVPSSAPSKKGHADVVSGKLIARHLRDRSLRSVPSPGVGH
ncbi:hypothetical protein TIFTF001_012702 [Ficus carica]|uniref:Uncharacterized protein n=1 Tax=Ficus carica TaxID=3494 RepID=A0AA88D6I1_FICCA|nr:hypothetical protein TIFTF001_012702 [Ficus carica]